MNLFNILQEIEQVDPEVYERLSARRRAMRQFAGFGRKIALASLPFALGSMFKKAYAQSSTANVESVLQFALSLEYLEAEFYSLAIAAPSLIPAGPALTAITAIRDHENQHVNFLKTTLESLDAKPVAKPTFDFSGGKGSNSGPFADVFLNYDTFLAVAQTFEDTGVRAYKGQAPELLGAKDILTAALNIHSVEARHAAHIRQMRKARGANVKPWITGNDSGIGAAVDASYKGEETEVQGGIKLVDIKGKGITVVAATEAFDEPLTKSEVLAIVEPFIVP
jgi:rubrerythrin